jgi:voltage-gated potassium channel
LNAQAAGGLAPAPRTRHATVSISLDPDTTAPPAVAIAAPPAAARPSPAWRLFSLAMRGLILYSVVTYFIEIEVVHSANSRVGPPFFLWSERAVAAIFTLEYLLRWRHSRSRTFPLTPAALLDLGVVLPFWIGFYVHPSWLGWVRSLRVLRLFRFFYHDPEMAAYVRVLTRAWPYARAAVKVLGVVVLTYVAAIYQMEHTAQPGRFGSLRDTLYFAVITLTTVGFGDIAPVTTGGRMITIAFVLVGGVILASIFAVVTTSFVNEMLAGRHRGDAVK